MSKKLFFLFLLIIIGLVFIFVITKQENPTPQKDVVTIGQNSFFVEIVDNTLTRARGLSGREALSPNQGMLFVFDTPDIHGFWMKDMLFPIDILWIDENFVINHIEKDVSPETYPKTFYPETPSLYVLELLSGSVDLFDIKNGDSVTLEKK